MRHSRRRPSPPSRLVSKLSPPPLVVAQRLRSAYGRPSAPRAGSLLAALVRTVLSQNTAGANARAAYENLRKRFPEWQDLARASLTSIERAIRPAGLAKRRAAVIRAVVRILAAEDPALELAEWQYYSTEELMVRLLSLPGVGPKTAACVVLFEFGRPVFPVDTHILRVAKRLGWLPPRATAEQAQVYLQDMIPPSQRLELHLNLIAHGRRVCRAQQAECEACVLWDVCSRSGVEGTT
ncbi:MAG: endonuclease III [Armatimonadetes bacterium]|nr:endonuclease III [Armatimonadota bacterium]